MEPVSAPYRKIENKDASSIRLKFSGGNVPKYPLYCRIQNADNPKQKGAVYPAGSAHLLNECDIPLPTESENYIIYPSLDGLNPMSTNFTFSFFATRPRITQSYMHSDGNYSGSVSIVHHCVQKLNYEVATTVSGTTFSESYYLNRSRFTGSAAIVIFDREVNIAALVTCEDILTAETLKALGGSDYLRCRWATKHQLVVFLPKREKSKVCSEQTPEAPSTRIIYDLGTCRLRPNILRAYPLIVFRRCPTLSAVEQLYGRRAKSCSGHRRRPGMARSMLAFPL